VRLSFVIFRRVSSSDRGGGSKAHEKNRIGLKILRTIELVKHAAHGNSSACGRKTPRVNSDDSFGQSRRAGLRRSVRSNTAIVIESRCRSVVSKLCTIGLRVSASVSVSSILRNSPIEISSKFFVSLTLRDSPIGNSTSSASRTTRSRCCAPLSSPNDDLASEDDDSVTYLAVTSKFKIFANSLKWPDQLSPLCDHFVLLSSTIASKSDQLKDFRFFFRTAKLENRPIETWSSPESTIDPREIR
jgi:hypothetical protein